MSGVAAGAFALFNRIVFVGISESSILILMTGPTQVRFSFDQIVIILRAMGRVTGQAPVIERLMTRLPFKRGLIVTGKTLFVSGLFLEKFIVR